MHEIPHFIILGGAKCGTTSLYFYLNQHPQILPSSKKELFFFNKSSKTVEWYRNQFPESVKSDEITGEGTPIYLVHPQVARRIYEYNPKIKLIVLLRNPVERAYSQYHHFINTEKHSFEDALEIEKNTVKKELIRMEEDENYIPDDVFRYSLVERGLYHKQLERYYRYFDTNQIHIIKSEDLFQNPQKVCNKVLKFLGLPRCKLKDREARNTRSYHKMNPDTEAMLYDRFRAENQKLYKLIGKDFNWEEGK
ncbi:sulfotransferase domain-containing protein [Rossellomorea aquimaris]|uniref:sulfotransferase domain-containing protein n=1 Tax=Rossellomorea aquimaris TaxID=189382 RepID=UPI001CD6913A|nr:sulfotransferase domain-containing protein [Rossellomorea aquimaris]MCA1059073.1 sulfotransferase domain-containing protein [Rossellomorea aquimaris]